jgi:hypothetical protein
MLEVVVETIVENDELEIIGPEDDLLDTVGVLEEGSAVVPPKELICWELLELSNVELSPKVVELPLELTVEDESVPTLDEAELGSKLLDGNPSEEGVDEEDWRDR